MTQFPMTQSPMIRADFPNRDGDLVQHPGSIQPHGAMLVCETESATIAFASANAADRLGIAAEQLLGHALVEILGEDNTHDLRNALTKSGASSAGAALSGVRLAGSTTEFDVVAHRHQERLIVEFEPAHPRQDGDAALDATQTLIRRSGLETDVAGIAATGARLVRATFSYDRVMIYRFLPDDVGQVIAESSRPDMRSFLNQRFPATDIPVQLRRAYVQNGILVVADSSYEAVPLLAAPGARATPPDLSYSHLRSVSPAHCEYLRNRGVAASLSIAIIVDGRLWGLIACQHDSSRTVPLPLRTAAEMFGQYFSLQITAAERGAELRHSELLEAQRSLAEQRHRIRNDELNHRVKNILALVKSIASQTGTHTASVAEYSASLAGRLRALSYAHDHSLALDSRGDLLALLDAEASLYRDGLSQERVLVNGPRVGFTEAGFGAFALVIHEMMTNAAKYGALSTPDGQLSIDWLLNADGDCEIEWSESGGPTVAVPTRKGFGSTLIGSTVTYDLGGTVDLQYLPAGLQARFIIPARHVVPIDSVATALPAVAAAVRPLHERSVLLVEDRALIALDTEDVLYQLGAAKVVSCPGVAAAREVLARQLPDVVVLDFNLGNETSAELADWLADRGIPFAFLTGYADTATIPARFAAVPAIHKPVDMDNASQVLVALLPAKRPA